MAVQYDINGLVQFYFGFGQGSYTPPEALEFQPAELTSVLGTPIAMPLSLDDVMLPNEPLISVSGAKRMILTPIDGHDGTFKQLFSKDDYRIRIVGVAIDEANPELYPDQIVRQLRELAERKAALKVTNKLLSYFNINELVITDYDFPAVEGGMGYQPYSFSCLSDKTLELEIVR